MPSQRLPLTLMTVVLEELVRGLWSTVGLHNGADGFDVRHLNAIVPKHFDDVQAEGSPIECLVHGVEKGLEPSPLW